MDNLNNLVILVQKFYAKFNLKYEIPFKSAKYPHKRSHRNIAKVWPGKLTFIF